MIDQKANLARLRIPLAQLEGQISGSQGDPLNKVILPLIDTALGLVDTAHSKPDDCGGMLAGVKRLLGSIEGKLLTGDPNDWIAPSDYWGPVDITPDRERALQEVEKALVRVTNDFDDSISRFHIKLEEAKAAERAVVLKLRGEDIRSYLFSPTDDVVLALLSRNPAGLTIYDIAFELQIRPRTLMAGTKLFDRGVVTKINDVFTLTDLGLEYLAAQRETLRLRSQMKLAKCSKDVALEPPDLDRLIASYHGASAAGKIIIGLLLKEKNHELSRAELLVHADLKEPRALGNVAEGLCRLGLLVKHFDRQINISFRLAPGVPEAVAKLSRDLLGTGK